MVNIESLKRDKRITEIARKIYETFRHDEEGKQITMGKDADIFLEILMQLDSINSESGERIYIELKEEDYHELVNKIYEYNNKSKDNKVDGDTSKKRRVKNYIEYLESNEIIKKDKTGRVKLNETIFGKYAISRLKHIEIISELQVDCNSEKKQMKLKKTDEIKVRIDREVIRYYTKEKYLKVEVVVELNKDIKDIKYKLIESLKSGKKPNLSEIINKELMVASSKEKIKETVKEIVIEEKNLKKYMGEYNGNIVNTDKFSLIEKVEKDNYRYIVADRAKYSEKKFMKLSKENKEDYYWVIDKYFNNEKEMLSEAGGIPI